MRSSLESVINELKQLKQEGVEGVYIGDSTLEDLRKSLGSIGSIDYAREHDSGKPWDPVSEKSAQSKGSLTELVKDNTDKPKSQPTKSPPLNQHGKPITPIPDSPPVVVLPEGDKQERWNALREQVLNDPVCLEHLNPGAQVVFGVGSIDADIFFCGEAPGGDEEKQGEPFVGRAGELLTKIIQAMGLSRQDVYIGNILNWRPEMPTPVGNRPPTPEEMAYCLPYLRAQIEVVQPKILVALGMTAVNGLLEHNPNRKMGAIRGKFFELNNTPLLVTYHPSYLLRYASLKIKRLVWEDMMLAMENVSLPISDKQKNYFL